MASLSPNKPGQQGHRRVQSIVRGLEDAYKSNSPTSPTGNPIPPPFSTSPSSSSPSTSGPPAPLPSPNSSPTRPLAPPQHSRRAASLSYSPSNSPFPSPPPAPPNSAPNNTNNYLPSNNYSPNNYTPNNYSPNNYLPPTSQSPSNDYSPNTSPSRPAAPAHQRRPASVSYSPSNNPFSSPSSTPPAPSPPASAPLPSPPFTFKSSAFTSPHVRRASLDYNSSNLSPTPLPPPLPAPVQHHRRSMSMAPSLDVGLEEVPEEDEDELDSPTTNGHGEPLVPVVVPTPPVAATPPPRLVVSTPPPRLVVSTPPPRPVEASPPPPSRPSQPTPPLIPRPTPSPPPPRTTLSPKPAPDATPPRPVESMQPPKPIPRATSPLGRTVSTPPARPVVNTSSPLKPTAPSPTPTPPPSLPPAKATAPTPPAYIPPVKTPVSVPTPPPQALTATPPIRTPSATPSSTPSAPAIPPSRSPAPGSGHRRAESQFVPPSGHQRTESQYIPPSGHRRAESQYLPMSGHKRAESEYLPLSPTSPTSPYKVSQGLPTPVTPNFSSTPITPTSPLSPISPSPTPNRQPPPAPSAEHARKHSRIHERNLSAFFPRPGQQPGVGYGDTYDDPNRAGGVNGEASVRDVPRAGSVELPQELKTQTANRRGHHHRHSTSHNFFSATDPGLTSPTGYLPNGGPMRASSPSSPSGSSPYRPTTPISTYLPPPSHLRPKYSRVPGPIRLVLFIILYLPLSTQLAILLSAGQVVMGALLWIWGQSGESLAVTGLGYLVVFDGIGGLSTVLVEGGKGVDVLWNTWRGGRLDKGVRYPYGTARLVTLAHFSQAIYLLFSAVYVLKESIEHVLLFHGSTEAEGAHGIGHGGMGHGDGGGAAAAVDPTSVVLDPGIVLPVTLLVLSALASLVSAIALRNHQALSDAVGPSPLSFSRARSSRRNVIDLIVNPFTLTILFFSGGLALASFTIPHVQLAPLDKVLALLQSVAMFYIAYPAAVATGQVLLQTAPPKNARQMQAFAGGLQDIENHPMVVSVTPPHIWQLTPGPASAALSSSSTPSRRYLPSKDEASTLIATLHITVAEDASDQDILQLTKFARERCAPAMKIDKGEQGELTVSVSRGKKRPVVNFFEHKSLKTGLGGDEHGHSHSHSNSGHSHQH